MREMPLFWSLEVSQGGQGRVLDVHAFAYRAPRFALTLPLEFCVDDSWISGHTRDLSDQGLLVRLSQPVVTGTLGRVRLRIDSCFIELAAEVAYAELYEAGLKFKFASQAEQHFVETLVRIVSRNKPLPR